MPTVLTVLFTICCIFFLNLLVIVHSRTVPAKDDICTRYPQFSLCIGGGQAPPKEQPPIPPTAPPPVEKQPLDRATYCKKYQLHYTYFCSPGVDDHGGAAVEFCQAYGTNCDVKAAPQAYTKEQIANECKSKKSLAETYCVGNEPAAIRTQCDQYRQYCLGGQQPQPAPAVVAPVIPQGPVDPVQYCSAYQPQYITACQAPRPPQGPLPQSNFGRKRRQSDPLAAAAALGYTPDKINALCNQYQGLASTYCTGNEPAGQIRDKCNLYRTYCLNQQPAAVAPVAPQPQQPRPQPQQPQPQPQQPQTALGPNFCQNYVATCSNLPANQQASQIQILCANYAYMADTFCPGYETAQNRITCNNYRMYCQNRQPFRDVDGTLGFNNGIANIPDRWGNGLLGFQG